MSFWMLKTGLLLGLLLLAAWQDSRRFRIANLLTLGGALLGLALNLLPAGQGAIASVAGWGMGLLLLLPLYAFGLMGAGDVKLLAMVGAFTGVPAVLVTALCTLLAGGVLALGVAVASGRLRQVLRNVEAMTLQVAATGMPPGQKAASAGRLPYGVAILFGTVAMLLWRAG